MKVFKLYFDKDKETTWINEMADKGYALVSFCAGVYTFEACEPGEYTYQIDWTKGLFSVTDDYRAFMKEMHTEIVCLWGPWVILRKKKEEGKFELYTDAESQIAHYTKILWMFKVVTILELIGFGIEYYCAIAGATIGYFFMIILAIMCVAFIRITVNTKKRIVALKKEAGLIDNDTKAGNGPHPALLSGLFLNLIVNYMGNHTEASDVLVGFLAGVAIVLMLVGAYFTMRDVAAKNN